jgi:hypothetical protein
MDMDNNLFEHEPYGRLALKKMGAVPDNFRLYQVGWINEGVPRPALQVVGAEFESRGGGHYLIPGSKRVAYITPLELLAE